MSEDKRRCAWCEAIKAGKTGIYPTYAVFCREHLEIWLHVASHALAYQLRLITKAKWVWERDKAKRDGAAVCGVHLIQVGKQPVPRAEGGGPA